MRGWKPPHMQLVIACRFFQEMPIKDLWMRMLKISITVTPYHQSTAIDLGDYHWPKEGNRT